MESVKDNLIKRQGKKRPLPIRKREGKENREKIFQFINKNGPVNIDKISNATGIHVRTVINHVNQLVKHKRVYKNKEKGKYPTYVILDHDLGYMTTFAENVKDAFKIMLNPRLFPTPEDEDDITNNDNAKQQLQSVCPWFVDPYTYEEFCNSVAGISVSKAISKTKISKENIDSIYLFEFANRIGAYITYLFIESMRPINYNIKETEKKSRLLRRDDLSQNLLKIAIGLEQLFESFHNLIYNTGQIDKPPYYYSYAKQKPLFFELYKQNHDKLSNTFKKVYPGIYNGLENYWQQIAKSWLINSMQKKQFLTEKKITCDHKWNPVNIFKLEGEYYHCRKCNNVVDGHLYSQLITHKIKK